MNVFIFQLLTIGSLFALLIFIRFYMENEMPDAGEVLWYMRSEQIGTPKKRLGQVLTKRKNKSVIELPEGCYLAGNRFHDEIFVASSGAAVRMYLNIQKETIYLSVLKGHIYIDNQLYGADRSSRIEILQYSRIRIADVEIQFEKFERRRGN